MACALALALMATHVTPVAMAQAVTGQAEYVRNQWLGKRVAFLGDSITDERHVGTTKCYWEYLTEMLGVEAYSYAVNGDRMDGLLAQAKRLLEERGQDIDAIIIFAGTNDFNASVPLGWWYDEVRRDAQLPHGATESRTYRCPSMDKNTFRGRINRLMDFLKTNFPTKQVIMLTPLHRGFAQFSPENVQPEEAFPNRLGIYVDAYVQTVKEAGNVWAVPVIDLNSLSGLYPLNDAYAQYFHQKSVDRLHPNAEGHRRMALTLKYQLLSLPSSFE